MWRRQAPDSLAHAACAPAVRHAVRAAPARRAPAHRVITTAAAGDAAEAPAAAGGAARAACVALAALAALKGSVVGAAPHAVLTKAMGAQYAGPVNTPWWQAPTSIAWVYGAWLLVLKDAIDHGRLASDTYRRLSLGLLGMAGIIGGLLAANSRLLELHALGRPTALTIATLALSLLTWLSVSLYRAGSGGRTPLDDAGEIAKQFASGLGSCLKMPANAFSAYYAYLALLSAGLFAALLPTGLFPLLPAGALDAVGMYLKRAVAAGMWLIGVTAYTLKDASDRGRLGASTFKFLNLALFVTFSERLWHLYRLGSAGVEVLRPLWWFILAQCALGATVSGAAFLTAKK